MPMQRIHIDEKTVTKARHLYENTKVPVIEIADMMKVSERTLHKRRSEWGWRRRVDCAAELKARIAVAAALALPDPAPVFDLPPVGDAAPSIERLMETQDEPQAEKTERFDVVKRIRDTIEREVVAVELVLRRIPSGLVRSETGERAARTLATLVRTLNELKRLEAGDSDGQEDDCPRDIGALRAALADKLERLKREVEGKPPLKSHPRRDRRPR